MEIMVLESVVMEEVIINVIVKILDIHLDIIDLDQIIKNIVNMVLD